jgi:glycerol uptake facilitator-like aquaporin
VTVPLARRALAELVGTAALVAVVIGSGIMAQTLSPQDVGLQLLENSLTTVFGLGVLIVMLGPVSGAHFNTVVSLADWWAGRRTRTGLSLREVAAYTGAQVAGAVAGAVLANAMFGRALVSWSQKDRSSPHLWLGELVATAGLIMVIFALVRNGRASVIPVAVASYIGAAYWFTSSTSFANPAVTIGRMFSNTFAGIAPAGAPAFIAAQLVGGAVGLLLVGALYPAATAVPSAGAREVAGQNGQVVESSRTGDLLDTLAGDL